MATIKIMLKYLTKQKFHNMVQLYMSNHKIDCIDAIIKVCDELSIDIDEAPKYIDNALLDKITTHARTNRLIKTSNVNTILNFFS